MFLVSGFLLSTLFLKGFTNQKPETYHENG